MKRISTKNPVRLNIHSDTRPVKGAYLVVEDESVIDSINREVIGLRVGEAHGLRCRVTLRGVPGVPFEVGAGDVDRLFRAMKGGRR